MFKFPGCEEIFFKKSECTEKNLKIQCCWVGILVRKNEEKFETFHVSSFVVVRKSRKKIETFLGT